MPLLECLAPQAYNVTDDLSRLLSHMCGSAACNVSSASMKILKALSSATNVARRYPAVAVSADLRMR
jgi:hypothetical protein